ncbi:MAG: protein kinase [Planctomycetota bacterium]|nr:protein kinase [Planctomycetota bacterium]
MNDAASHARGLLERAIEVSRRSPVDQALPRFQEARTAFENAGDERGIAETWIEEARSLAGTFGRRALAQAHAALDQAGAALDPAADVDLRARLLHVRGYAQFREGRVADAIETLQQAERAFREAQDASGEARVLDTLGVLWERGADRERAAMLFARSYALKQRAQDDEGLAVTLGNLGRLALHGGRIDEAIEFFQLDLAIARSLGDPQGEAVVLTNLAECALAQGRTEDARTRARAVLDIATDLGKPVTRGYAHAAMADAHRLDGALDTAGEEAAAAEAAFAEVGMAAGIAHARLIAARIHGDARRPDAAGRAALGAARAARAARQNDIAIEALLAAHAAFTEADHASRAARCLARAQDTAVRSGFPDLVDRVRRRQRGAAISEASVGGVARVRIEQGVGPFEGRTGGRVPLAIEGFLGQGAFAMVLRVVDTETGTACALKRLTAGRERMRALTQRLRREFTAMARVPEHPGLVRPLAFGDEDGRPCLVLELVVARDRHRSLEELMLDTGRLPERRMAQLGAQVADALAVLHGEGIVHRDVKPSNVLLGEDGAAVLTDYGLAYDMEESAYVPTAGFTGTLGYAAPELFDGDEAWTAPTPAADLYALGVMLFQGLTGDWPFRQGSLAGMIRAKLAADYRWDRLAGVSPEIAAVVRDLLASDVAARPATAREVATALASIGGTT